MILKALRRARFRHRILFAALLLFIAGLFGAVGVTSAFFQAELDTKTNTFAGGYLAVPTIGGVLPNTSTSSGYNGVLTWTNGTDQTTTDNEVQQIFGADQGTTNNCTGAVYSTTVLNSTTSPTTTQAFTYTDAGRATSPSNINGDWYCYEVVHGWPNTTAPVWTATATTNVQIGLAPISVVINNGLTGDGTINNKDGSAGARHNLADTIVVTYNQPVTMTSGTGTVGYCTYPGTPGTILFGDSTCTAASASSEIATIGRLSETVGGAAHTKKNASISVSGNKITITISQAGSAASGTPSFVSQGSSGTVNSSVGAAVPCTSGASTCTLTASGNF